MNAASRPTPFTLVFGAIAPERFPGLREAIAAAKQDPWDRDGFLLVKEVVELLRELRPDEGLGEGMGTMAAFLHQAYLFWMNGEPTDEVGEPTLRAALESPAGAAAPSGPPPSGGSSRYVQLPPLRVWGVPVEGVPAEPLDGWFATRAGDRISMLAIFGLHPGRAGFTAVEVEGSRPVNLERPDGSVLFQPTLSGGAAAGLASVAGAEELLELAWRIAA